MTWLPLIEWVLYDPTVLCLENGIMQSWNALKFDVNISAIVIQSGEILTEYDSGSWIVEFNSSGFSDPFMINSNFKIIYHYVS